MARIQSIAWGGSHGELQLEVKMEQCASCRTAADTNMSRRGHCWDLFPANH
jgi:hypothetical protein